MLSNLVLGSQISVELKPGKGAGERCDVFILTNLASDSGLTKTITTLIETLAYQFFIVVKNAVFLTK